MWESLSVGYGERFFRFFAGDFRNATARTAGCGFWKAPPEGGHGFREMLAELIE